MESKKNTVTFEEFNKVDIRVGTIIEATDFPKAHKPAYQLKIDFGHLGIKKSSAQITSLYTKEQLTGKKITAIVNFKPRQISDFMSEVLVLGIQENNNVILLKGAVLSIKNGTQIS